MVEGNEKDIAGTDENEISIASPPSVDETYPLQELDDLAKYEHQHQEPLVHHHREDHGMESDSAHQMMDNYMPGWLHEASHGTAGLHGDRIALVAIVALTLLLIHLINSCMDRGAREAPLIRRLAEMDKKLFASSNELLLLRKEVAEGPPPSTEPTTNPAVLRSLEVQVEQARAETEEERRRMVEAEARVACLQEEVDRSKQEAGAAVEETQQAQGMVEELLQEKARLQEGGGADKQLLDVVQRLQSQLEGQRGLLLKYEPKLKKKEKEAKELTKEVKQMKADVANANLDADHAHAGPTPVHAPHHAPYVRHDSTHLPSHAWLDVPRFPAPSNWPNVSTNGQWTKSKFCSVTKPKSRLV